MNALNQVLQVDLGERSYDIHIGTGLLDACGPAIAPLARSKHAFIVTDDTVAPHYLSRVQTSLRTAGLTVHSHIVPAGEQAKSWDQVMPLLDAMLEARSERGTMVVALGGGVVGDLAGFAAAILLRGVDFVQIPTTLLSQVDSSVGGKTGINARQGKNLIGSFHQPRLVLADTSTLHTLPKRDLLSGYAEVAKYGLINDADFWTWLETSGGAAVMRLDQEATRQAVYTSCVNKAQTVARDEKETGVRALLNLGHTFGHALEAESGYGDFLLHGEAVAVGMVLAFQLSVKMGLCPAEDATRVRTHLSAVGLPVHPPRRNGQAMNPENLMEHFANDKKVRDGKTAFVLTRGIGKAFLCREVDPALLLDFLHQAICA